MKRSEMIQKIKKSFNDMDDMNSLTDYGAELHLKMLEEAGMLAPRNGKKYLGGPLPTKLLYTWDPEDEDKQPRSGAV